MSRRFADAGWAGNPLLRRVMQAYLAAAETAALQAAIDCRAMARAIAAARGTDLVRRALAGHG